MSFYKRYELARLIQEDDAKTFSAVQIATGRPVVLHLLAPSATLSPASLRDIVARAEQHSAVLEVGEFAGSYYIAAEPPESPQSFRQWVELLPPAQPGKAIQPASPPLSKPKPVVRPAEPSRKLPEVRKLNIPPSPPAEPALGEFTELFGVPKAKISGKNEPGEFTRMFYGGAPGKPTKAAPPAPADLNDTGGEFTKMFGGEHSPQAAGSLDEFNAVFDSPLSEPPDAAPVAAVPLKPSWPEAAPKEDETSEYTKFFGNALPSEPVDIPAEQAKQAGVVEAKEKPFQQASDFTRMFGPGGVTGKTPPPPASLSPVSEGTSVSMIFGAPPPGLGSPKSLVVAPTAAGIETDDYAKVVAASKNPLPFDNPVPAPVPAATNKRNTGLVIVIVVVGIVLLSLLIWVIATRVSR